MQVTNTHVNSTYKGPFACAINVVHYRSHIGYWQVAQVAQKLPLVHILKHGKFLYDLGDTAAFAHLNAPSTNSIMLYKHL